MVMRILSQQGNAFVWMMRAKQLKEKKKELYKRGHKNKIKCLFFGFGWPWIDLLWVMCQGRTFFDRLRPPRTLTWCGQVFVRCGEPRELDPLDFSLFSWFYDSHWWVQWAGNTLSKKVWPWKVTINRSNGGHTKLKKNIWKINWGLLQEHSYWVLKDDLSVIRQVHVVKTNLKLTSASLSFVNSWLFSSNSRLTSSR